MYEENLPFIQKAFELRYKMLPYLYSLMYEASIYGMPVMRPLFLEFPDDKNCLLDKNLTFMFGPAILVANVLDEGAKTRTIYLPAGSKWYDMNDNFKCYEGGQNIELPVTLESIPMFLRGNTIFFTSDDIKHIVFDELKQLDFIISADEDCSFVFYDDDGHTQNYKKGEFSKINIKVSSGERKIIAFNQEGSYPCKIKNFTIKVLSKEKGAFWVTVDGKKISRFLVRDNWDEAEEGWYYNLSDRTVLIKFPKPEKFNFDVVISTEKFDLIGMNEE